MIPCEHCGRHVRAADARCPFCSTSRGLERLTALAGAVMTPFVLAACYGAPPCDALVDADEDGFSTCVEFGEVPGEEDCDDANAAVNPAATESCDGIDNNCDYTVDEGCDTDGDSDDDTN